MKISDEDLKDIAKNVKLKLVDPNFPYLPTDEDFSCTACGWGWEMFKAIVEEVSSMDLKSFKSETLFCRDCDREFSLSTGEVKWYTEHKFDLPRRCKECRQRRKLEKEKENDFQKEKTHGEESD